MEQQARLGKVPVRAPAHAQRTLPVERVFAYMFQHDHAVFR